MLKRMMSVTSFGADEDKNKAQTSASDNWAILKQSLESATRHSVLETILKDLDNVNPNVVMTLGLKLLTEGWGSKLSSQSSKDIYIGALLVDWAWLHGVEVDKADLVSTARAHCEVWRTTGIAADWYNLSRARILYEEALKHLEYVIDLDTMVDYSRVLLYTGKNDEALKIVMSLMGRFETHPEFPSFLLYAGGL